MIMMGNTTTTITTTTTTTTTIQSLVNITYYYVVLVFYPIYLVVFVFLGNPQLQTDTNSYKPVTNLAKSLYFTRFYSYKPNVKFGLINKKNTYISLSLFKAIINEVCNCRFPRNTDSCKTPMIPPGGTHNCVLVHVLNLTLSTPWRFPRIDRTGAYRFLGINRVPPPK